MPKTEAEYQQEIANLQAGKVQLEQKVAQQEDTIAQAQATMKEPLFMQFANIHQQHMSEVQRQLQLQSAVSSTHTFDGLSEKYFKKWLKDMDRLWLAHKDDLFMRCVIFKTVKDLAADYWADVTTKTPTISWNDARDGFMSRFSTFVSADIAKDKLKNIKQHKGEELYAFAQRIGDLAKQAYEESVRDDPVMAQILADTFIDGLNAQNKAVARKLVKHKVSDIKEALDVAIEEQLLHKSYALRHIGTSEYADDRHIEPMEVDAVSKRSQNKELKQIKDQLASLTTAVKSQRPPAANENRGRGASRGRGAGRGFGRGNDRGNVRGRGRGRGRGNNQSTDVQHHWSESGRPICSHCKREGHMMSRCWQLHPERRPQNDSRTQNQSLNQ